MTSEWSTPEAHNNRQMQSVGKIVEATRALEVELPADVVTAATALNHLSAVKLDANPVHPAIEEHASAWLSAAAKGKDVPLTKLTAAINQAAALDAQKAALHKAKTAGTTALIRATQANHEELIKAVQPAFDKALADLVAATNAIPATMTDLADITTAGLSQQWLKAHAAVETLSHCYDVRDGVRSLGMRASVDQEDSYGWIKDDQDKYRSLRSIDNLTDRYIAMVRKGAQLWLSTASEHEDHYKELVAAKARLQQSQPNRDPFEQRKVEQSAQVWAEHKARLPGKPQQ